MICILFLVFVRFAIEKSYSKSNLKLLILSQHHPKINKHDEIIQKRNEIKQQKLSAREKRLLKELEENKDKINPITLTLKKYQPRKKTIKITKLDKAFKGAVRSFEVNIINQRDPLSQLNDSNKTIQNHLKH